ncbi:MAG: HEAT repeat domain-containing protein, partial [Planctomycetia bacterium]|nr:HEAT repeat domain-containing protein [Planctomycetia bacterium]
MSLPRLAAFLVVALHSGPAARAEGPADRDPSVDGKVAGLKAPEANDRAEAARSLGLMGPKAGAAVPALVEALGDADGVVRVRAASALGRVGGPLKAALPVILAARNGADERVRAEAEAAWARIGPGVRAAIPYVLDLLRRNDGQSQQKASAALGKNGLDATPALIDVFALEHSTTTGPNFFVRSPVFGGGFSRGTALNNAQIQLNTRLRALAVEAVGKLGPPVVPTLLEALKDRDESVREGAAQAIGLIGPDAAEAVPALIRGLRDRDAQVRLRAVEALARAGRGSPVALSAL